MGAWGAGVFDNDTALDFVGGLQRVRSWSTVLTALNEAFQYPAIRTHLPPARPDGSRPSTLVGGSHAEWEAAAALEVVATAIGVPGPGYDQSAVDIAAWVARHPLPARSYIPHLARLVADSMAGAPLIDDWNDGGAGWRASAEALADRLHRARVVTPDGERRARAWRTLSAMAPEGAFVLLEHEPSLAGALRGDDLASVLQRPEAWAREIGLRATAHGAVTPRSSGRRPR